MRSRLSTLGLLVVMAAAFGSMGSFKLKPLKQTFTVTIEHPGCTLLEPAGELNNLEGVGSAVRVSTGKQKFRFNCEGKELTTTHEVKGRERALRFDAATAAFVPLAVGTQEDQSTPASH